MPVKRGPASAAAQTLTDQVHGPTERQRLQEAADILEASTKVKPVRLRDINVRLQAGQTVELRGEVPAATRVHPRTQDSLRKGLRVLEAEVQETSIRLLVQNCGKRSSVTVTPKDVLADVDTEDICEALVGPACEEQIEVEGVKARCLLDSGSQVTMVTEEFYHQHLSHLPLQELRDPINVVGAGGQAVSYLGFIEMKCRLPEALAGEETVVSVATLVGAGSTDFAKVVPIILGTNVFKNLPRFPLADTVRCEAKAMMAQAQDRDDIEGRLGSILVQKRVVVPPLSTVQVKGKPKVKNIQSCHSVLIQEHTGKDQNQQLGVVSTKVGTDDLHDVQLTLCNFSEEELVLRKNVAVADVFVVHAMYDVNKVVDELREASSSLDVTVQAHTVTQASRHNDTQTAHSDSDFSGQFSFGENAPSEWRSHFINRLSAYSDVFISHDLDLGRTEAVQHDIELQPGCSVRDRPRPISPRDFEEAKQHIQGLLEAQIITPSCSPFASPIVLVRKKNNTLRLCVDYRAVNRFTIKDSYAIPKIDDLFLTLNGSKWFSSMDLSKAYYQVPLTERAKQISAFTTPFGLFQFERMPFGLSNSPGTFQRLMDKVFVDMNLSELIVFLDDILVHGRTLEELEDRTIRALERLRQFKLKLDPKKCVFGTNEVRHLGHIISDKGIRPDPDKISALTTWPIPRTVKDVKSFIGFAGFYRKFLPKFSQLAKPLNDLTAGYVPRGNQMKGEKKKGCLLLT